MEPATLDQLARPPAPTPPDLVNRTSDLRAVAAVLTLATPQFPADRARSPAQKLPDRPKARAPVCNDNYPVRLATIAVAGWAGLLATEDIVAAGFATGGFDGLVGGLEIEFLGGWKARPAHWRMASCSS